MFYDKFTRSRAFWLHSDEPLGAADHDELPETADNSVSESPVDELASVAAMLQVATSTDEGVEYALSDSSIVGRFDPNVGPIDVDLGGLSEGSFVSRRHAKIQFRDGQWFLEDLGSSNGTFLRKGEEYVRISEPTPLQDGDIIVFGKPQLVFKVVAAAQPEPECSE